MTTPAAPVTGTPAPDPVNPPVVAPPAPETVAAPWSGVKEGVYMLGEGEKAVPWWNGIQEEPVREYMKAKNYSTPDEAARAAWNANKINNMSPEVTAVLEGKATPEQTAAFYTKLGRPEAADKYDLQFGEGVKANDNLVKFGKDLFFEMGLNGKQAQAAADKWNTFVAEQNTATLEGQRVQNEAELKTLETKYGADLPKNQAAGNRAMQALGLSPELINKIEGQIGSAAIVELLVAIGRKSDEGNGMKSGNPGGDPNDTNTMTKDQAQQRITTLQSDAAFQKRYTDKADPGHADALALMEKLFAKAHSK